jgi:hypothetical protein
MPEAQTKTHAPRVNGALYAVLACTALMALAALLVRGAGLPVPAATEPRLAGLSLPGWQLTPRPGAPALEGPHSSHSAVRHWQVTTASVPDGLPDWELALTMVHVRHHHGLALAQLTRELPGLGLENPRLQELGQAMGKGLGDRSTVALGTLDGVPALQTCVVAPKSGADQPAAVAHVSSDTLVAAVDALRERSLRRQLRQWLGLEANVRWECMLVTIRALQATDEQLTDRWQQVSSALIAHEMH